MSTEDFIGAASYQNKKNPKSPYAWQKSAIEDYSKICWDLYRLDVVNLRYFNEIPLKINTQILS